ncbi:MAG TPA: hypothetical protein PLB25_20035, partial [Rhodoferax sp.]|nr:hypothetical protein [Rhodoferax sp.]
LLIGSVGALWVLQVDAVEHSWIARVIKLLFLPALLCLVCLPFFPVSSNHPGMDATLICLSTIIVILRNSGWLSSTRSISVLAVIGDFSW